MSGDEVKRRLELLNSVDDIVTNDELDEAINEVQDSV
jgi:hypothetical protein